ncbi:MAG: hypothetical protein K2G45_08540 [Lachnospiraceae bacterium]|nr:hypothetical protein [Lachnospiraceae bacterium]
MRKIKKAILSLSLVAAMVMGEAGVALAAGPNETAEVITENTNLDKATATTISNLEATVSRNEYLHIFFSGCGCKFDVNINGKLFKTIDNSDGVNENNTAPVTYYTQADFDDILYGGTYKVEVIPYLYTENGPVAGEARSTTVSVPALAISNVWYRSCSEAKQNGYQKAAGIQVNWNADAIAGTQYELQRKEGKGAWKTIAKTTEKSYQDKTAVIGKKYQYRVRYAGGKNDYGQAPAGKWASAKNVAVNVTAVAMSATYEGVGDGVAIEVRWAEDICSGYEIYRSTKKTKGYKKIARITGTSYEDKKVKSGTYYYKARAYYYDEETGKVYYGEFTEPKCVKLILGGINAWVKQTGKNQATLEWDPVKGVSSYEVWYKTEIPGDAYKFYKTTTGTKLKLSGLSSDTGYYFMVRAKKNGSSYYTSTRDYCYMGFHAPSPTIAKAKVTSNKAKTALTIKTTIKWDRIYGAQKIRIVGIKYGYDSNGNYGRTEKVLKTLKGTATSYTLTSKITTKNKGYDDIRVVAVRGKDERTGYLESYKSLLATKKLNVKRAGNAGSVVSWKAVAGATEYDVYRTSPYGYSMYVGSTTKCTYKDLNVTPGVQYTYEIVARNSKLNISSSYINSIVKTYTHKLGKTKIKSATNSAAKKATITWGKVSYASNYIVYRATSKNGKYKKVATVKNGKTTYTDKKLKKGTTYYYKVKATGKNAAGLTVSSVLSVSKSVKIKK